MVDVIRDIEVLENLLIAFQEGASDEKRMAVNAVERLLKEKQKILDDFEKEFCDDSQQAA
jgi:replicative superfamily II helicase